MSCDLLEKRIEYPENRQSNEDKQDCITTTGNGTDNIAIL